MDDRQNIVVLDGDRLNPGDNPWTEVAALGDLTVFDRTAPEEILSRAENADIILTNKCRVTAEMIAALPRLKFISVLATGYNIVDVEAAARRGIPVANIPVYGTNAVAQYTFALLLELCHHVGAHSASVAEGEWARGKDWSYWKTPLLELFGKTMVIVGFGRIGHRVGELARAFGMDVIAVDDYEAKKAEPGFAAFMDLDEAVSKADVISLNCALTAKNEGMIDRRLISLMKPGVLLINAARGQLIVERDLAWALNEGKIGGAALDVVSTEPIRIDNPLLGAKNCVITPHIAWAALAARKRLMHSTAENIRCFQEGIPQNIVNSPVAPSR